jgi:acetate---CoA ligase (ADP-forming)
VVMKSGRSALGMQMASTHSGSMAGDDELFTSLCTRLGFIRARTLSSFSETIKALEAWGGLSGKRMAVLTASGAACAMFADTCGDHGIVLPPPSSKMAAQLRPQLPHFAHVANPLDYNAAYTGAVGLTEENEAALYECFRTFLSDRFDVGVMHSDWTDQGPEGSPTLRAWARAATDTNTPAAVVTLMAENMSEDTNLFCRRNGLAALQGEEHACAAIAAAMKYGESLQSPIVSDFSILPMPTKFDGIGKLYDEVRSKDILGGAGVPFPLRVATNYESLVEAAESIGYPVVLKAVSTSIPHKHHVGAVVLGIKDPTDLRRAADEMRASLLDVGLKPESFLVERMIENVIAELIVGIKSSPIYGQALIIGPGGVRVEESTKLSAILLPVDRNHIERSLRELNIANKLSNEVISKILDIVSIVADFAQSNKKELSALDINPLIVTKDDQVIAVDALLEFVELK